MTSLEIEIKLIDAYWGFYDRMYINQILPLVWMIKNGEITWTPPKHSDPVLFGISEKEAINMRIRALRADRHELTVKYQEIKGLYLRGERPYGFIGMNSLQERLDKLSRNIHFLRARLKGEVVNQPFDLEAIKRVPIDSVVKINSNGFFQDNIFRQEKSPSNSLYLYRQTNRWTDFGSGRSGDVVDVVMAKENCSFKEACKLLNTMI
jgi:hypothetical protein